MAVGDPENLFYYTRTPEKASINEPNTGINNSDMYNKYDIMNFRCFFFGAVI